MTEKEINDISDSIKIKLQERELKSAFDALEQLIAGTQQVSYQTRLDELRQTYKNMLRYRFDGIADPMQGQIYRNLLKSAYQLNDELKISSLTHVSHRNYFLSRNSYGLSQGSVFKEISDTFSTLFDQESMEINDNTTKQHIEELENRLFFNIWCADNIHNEETNAIQSIINLPRVPLTTSCLIASALTLSLQEFFDERKMLLLFDLADSKKDEQIRIRALVGILLTLYIYPDRMQLYTNVCHRLAAMAETPGFTHMLRTITLRFILSRETEKIAQKIQDEIIPEMRKISSHFTNNPNLLDLPSEQIGEEMNPEWEKLFANKYFGKKMEEFGQMQEEGADVMHYTFVHLKSFPFFMNMGNWFLPFDSKHSMLNSVSNGFDKSNLLDMLIQSPVMCDSDKYSLYFSILTLPEEARKAMVGQFNQEMGEMGEQIKEELNTKFNKAETIVSQYIQDLYRFYKLYPLRNNFKDIFAFSLDFYNTQLLKPYLTDEESLTTFAEYYLRKNYFAEALSLYSLLAKQKQDSDILFQKMGYCKQMLGNIEGALSDYLHADLLNSESKWVIRHIANCYRTLKKPEEALKYYLRYETLVPDNLSIQISIGNCYLELKNYEEALKRYFKVDYLDSESHKAWRPMAWCSFMDKKYEQAHNYYQKIIREQPTAQDLLNAGHTEFALGDFPKAISFYLQSIKEIGSFDEFFSQFEQDKSDLLSSGISQSDIYLMLDQLRFTYSA